MNILGVNHLPSFCHRANLFVRLKKTPSFRGDDFDTTTLKVEVRVGGEQHMVEFPQPCLDWEHEFTFTPTVLDKDGILVCVDDLVVTVLEDRVIPPLLHVESYCTGAWKGGHQLGRR